MHQEIRYCAARDGVRLAYAVTGKGSPIVRVSHHMSHLDYELKCAARRDLVLTLAQRHRFLRYDARGIGLSQREVPEVSFEHWVGDLETVVDAAEFDRFALLGMSQGGAVAIQYAVRHPDRVLHLILYGAYARGHLHRDDRDRQQRLVELGRQLIREGWGSDDEAFRQWYTTQFIPDGTSDDFHLFNELQRVSATPAMAERFIVEIAKIDAVDLLPQVRVPTLIMHCTGDVRVPFALGQELAAGILEARLVPLASRNHQLLPHEPAWRQFLDEITAFIGDPPLSGPIPGTRTLR